MRSLAYPLAAQRVTKPHSGWLQDSTPWLQSGGPSHGTDISFRGIVELQIAPKLTHHCYRLSPGCSTSNPRNAGLICAGTGGSIHWKTQLFIPGNARHQINSVEDQDLMILSAFGISDFKNVQCRFSAQFPRPACGGPPGLGEHVEQAADGVRSLGRRRGG